MPRTAFTQSDTRLATDPDYAVIWELLHSCQEAALSDIPERYREYLSIFDTEHGGLESEPVNIQVCVQNFIRKLCVYCYCRAARKKTRLMDFSRLQGPQKSGMSLPTLYINVLGQRNAVAQSSELWSLPAVTRHLSQEDALRSPNVRVLNVAHVIPTAAVFLRPNPALVATKNEFRPTSEAAASAPATEEFSKVLESSASPLVHATEPLFASAVFTSASQISHRREQPSFYALWRYNRLAATSLLRQAHSFHMDIPVFGVLLRGDLVAFHIDWYEEREGVVVSPLRLSSTESDQ